MHPYDVQNAIVCWKYCLLRARTKAERDEINARLKALNIDHVNHIRRNRPNELTILSALEQCHGNRTEAARMLGYSRKTLFLWIARMKKRGLAVG